MARRRARRTDLDTRLRNMAEAGGLPAMGGLLRLGTVGAVNPSGLGGRVGGVPPAPRGDSAGRLLVLSATGDSIASGGDAVVFDATEERVNWSGQVADDQWTHPVDGVYTVAYRHAWDTYAGGGTIEVEVDGEVSTSTTLASGSSGADGSGTLSYYATAGSTGRIYVTQSSGSAQTCDAELWIAQTGAASVPTFTVELYLDGSLVAASVDPLEAVDWTSATLLLGELNGTVAATSDVYYDAVSVIAGGDEKLGNAGFESALASVGTNRTVSSGNWRGYQLGTATANVSALQAWAGSQSGRVDINSTGANQAAYLLQDVAITEGSAFEFSSRIYPTSIGDQRMSMLLGWNRSDSADHEVAVILDGSALSATAFGVTVTASVGLPLDEWSHVRLRVAGQELL